MGRDAEVQALCSMLREERIAIVSGQSCCTHRSHLDCLCPGCMGMPFFSQDGWAVERGRLLAR